MPDLIIMAKQNIEQKTEDILQPILARHQFELVDTEYVKEGSDWYLRAYIDKEGGITIDDCETVSRELEKELDALDLIKEAYILEVSSPGLTRPLKKEKDFARNLGKPVEVHTFKPIDGSKEFIGDLMQYDKEKVVLDIGPDGPETIEIPRSSISLIRQYVVF